jgi:hypothetical protein
MSPKQKLRGYNPQHEGAFNENYARKCFSENCNDVTNGQRQSAQDKLNAMVDSTYQNKLCSHTEDPI